MDPLDIYYRHRLPHIHPEGCPIFITFNLVESIPREVLRKLKEQREDESKALHANSPEKESIEKKYFDKYDEWLDSLQNGHLWLKDERIAQIVIKKILSFETRKI